MPNYTNTLVSGTELQRRVLALTEQAAELETRDAEITRQIAEAHATGDGDLEALTAERREVRATHDDLTAALPILRERLAQHRVTTSEALITDWLTDLAGPAAQQTHAARARELDRVQRLEGEMEEAQQAADRHALRATLLAHCSRALIAAFGLDLPPIVPPNTAPTEAHLRRSSLERALTLDELTEAVREVARIVGQDPDLAVPEFGEAIEVLLEAWPPKSPQDLMAARRERYDAPHRAEIARVDTWVKEQLAAGPVADDELRQRAEAADVPVQGRSALGWGQATLPDALRRVGAFAVVPYRGADPEDVAAASNYEDQGGRDGLWWVLHRTPGLMVPPEKVATAFTMHAIRA